jgi:DNA primase
MRISEEKINEIARANDIVDVISQYVRVRKAGKNFIALCPFHADKNPSLHISQSKQVYHCFSCKAGGNIFQFVQQYEKVTFIEAVKKLADRAGIELNENEYKPDLNNEITKLFEINKLAAKFYFDCLSKLQGEEKNYVYKYLDERNLKKNTVVAFGIGYAPKGWNNLYSYFMDSGLFNEHDLVEAGLLRERENNRYYDTFRGRIIFPIFNESGKVVAFGARKIYDDDEIAGKYINSPETPLYQKRNILYGLNFAADGIRRQDEVIVVEGYMDLISLHQAGITNVVASSGTAFTVEQVKLLSRYTSNVTLLFDSDAAGIKAAKSGIQLVLEENMNLNIVTLPEGEDPDSVISNKGADAFKKFLESRKSLIEFISLLYEKEDKLTKPEDKALFVKEIIRYISYIPDAIRRAFYIKDIARKFNLYESELQTELNKTIRQNKKESFPKSSVVIPTKEKAEDKKSVKKIPQEETELLEIFLSGDEEAIKYLENNLETDFIESEIVKNIVEIFLDEMINNGEINVSMIIDKLPSEEAKNLIMESSFQKYIISEYDSFDKHNLLYTPGKNMINYRRHSRDLIKKFKIKKINKIIEEKKHTKEGLLDIVKLKQMIKEIQMSKE